MASSRKIGTDCRSKANVLKSDACIGFNMTASWMPYIEIPTQKPRHIYFDEDDETIDEMFQNFVIIDVHVTFLYVMNN